MGKKILILDDEQEYITSLRNFLREFKYTVGATMFPDHALELIKKEKPDLVLFDYKLPDMDGDAFLKKAKEISEKPVYVLITAYKDDAIMDKFKKIGVADIILKPIDLENLLSKLQKILGKG